MGSLTAAVQALTWLLIACSVAATSIPSITYELARLSRLHGVQSVVFFGCNHRHPLHPMYLRKQNVNAKYICDLQDTTQSWTAEAIRAIIQGVDEIVLDSTVCYQGKCAYPQLPELVESVSKEAGTKILAVISLSSNSSDTLSLRVKKLDGQQVLGGPVEYDRFSFSQTAPPTSNVFEDIYLHKRWGDNGRGSGEGSSLTYTAPVRQYLVQTIQKYSIRTMMDSPCGGMLWMPLVLEQIQPPIFYTGLDVACRVVGKHHHEFRDRPNMEFFCADMCQQQLLKGYDLLFSRDALQHLPISYTFQFLNNVKASGAKYLMVGSYVKSLAPNIEIKIGDYYSINLLAPPFNCSQPLEMFDEQSFDAEKKYMLLYDVSQMSCATGY